MSSGFLLATTILALDFLRTLSATDDSRNSKAPLHAARSLYVSGGMAQEPTRVTVDGLLFAQHAPTASSTAKPKETLRRTPNIFDSVRPPGTPSELDTIVAARPGSHHAVRSRQPPSRRPTAIARNNCCSESASGRWRTRV